MSFHSVAVKIVYMVPACVKKPICLQVRETGAWCRARAAALSRSKLVLRYLPQSLDWGNPVPLPALASLPLHSPRFFTGTRQWIC